MVVGEIHHRSPQPARPSLALVTVCLSGATSEPLLQKAPVLTFSPITRVENFTYQGFCHWSPVWLCLGSGLARCTAACASLPQRSDYSKTHWSVTRSSQSAAMINNIASVLPKGMKNFCYFEDTGLNLCASPSVYFTRITGWNTLLEHPMVLCVSSSIWQGKKYNVKTWEKSCWSVPSVGTVDWVPSQNLCWSICKYPMERIERHRVNSPTCYPHLPCHWSLARLPGPASTTKMVHSHFSQAPPSIATFSQLKTPQDSKVPEFS